MSTFDGRFFGFVAIGDKIVFRSFSGEVDVMTVPPDLDSHTIAAALNTNMNTIINLLRATSDFKV